MAYASFEQTIQEYKIADSIYAECIAGLSKRYGPHWKTLRKYYCLYASNFSLQHKDKEAITLLEKSLKLIPGSSKVKDVWYFRTLANLAVCYSRLGDFASAEKYIELVLELPECPATIDEYFRLASLYGQENKLELQKTTLGKALELIKRHGELDSQLLNIGKVELGMAKVFTAESKNNKAKLGFENAIRDISNSKVDKLHQRDNLLAQALGDYGTFLLSQKKYDDACKYFMKSADAYEGIRTSKPQQEAVLRQWLDASKYSKHTADQALVKARLAKLVPSN